MSQETAWWLGSLLLHTVLASAVTAHALLRRIQPQSAVAWIGVAWLSPFFGAALYLLFGINRVRRKALRLTGPGRRPPPARHVADLSTLPREEAENLKPLARLGTLLTGWPLLSGNRIEPLVDGDAAYPAMVAAIEAAQKSVLLASYIFHDDEAGGPIVEALVAAHRRGVAVRVLLDGVGSGYFRSGGSGRLLEAGVPVARFMHSFAPWRMAFLNLRNHKKLLVADGRLGFTGGMNVWRKCLWRSGRYDGPHGVQDVHFRLSGPVVSHLVASFVDDWAFTTGEVLEGPLWFPRQQAAGGVAARGLVSGPDEDNEKLLWTLAAAIGRAHERIVIVTPYFLPDDRLTSQLALAALRGVEVEILLPKKTDFLFFDWAMRAGLAPLMRAGCRFVFTDPPFDHSKLMVVDRSWVLIGSGNWDMRSLRLNFEFNVEAYDDDFAATIETIIAEKRARGREATRDDMAARPLPAKLRDAAFRLATPYL